MYRGVPLNMTYSWETIRKSSLIYASYLWRKCVSNKLFRRYFHIWKLKSFVLFYTNVLRQSSKNLKKTKRIKSTWIHVLCINVSSNEVVTTFSYFYVDQDITRHKYLIILLHVKRKWITCKIEILHVFNHINIILRSHWEEEQMFWISDM